MKYGFLMGCLLWGIGATAQVELDLKESRALALEHSKQLAIAEREKQQAVWMERLYRANYFPKLSASGFYFYNQKKMRYQLKEGILDVPIRLSLRGVYSAGLQLEQPLFLGGKIRAAHRVAKEGYALAGEQVRDRRAGVIVEVDKAYWQCVRVQELVAVAQRYKETVQALVRDLEEAYRTGMISLNEVLKVRVRYNEAELQLQQAQHGSTLARMNLCRLVGLELHAELRLMDSLSGTLTPGILEQPTALSQRPDYNMLERQVRMKQEEVRVARADFLPRVGLLAGYGASGGVKLNGDGSHSRSFSALASVQVPLFHWGEGRNKVRVARVDWETARLNQSYWADLMELDIAGSRFKVTDAFTRVQLARTALTQAEEHVKVSRNQYDVGLETLTNLLEAQTQWQQAWSDWVEAKAELRLSETEYLQSIGLLE